MVWTCPDAILDSLSAANFEKTVGELARKTPSHACMAVLELYVAHSQL